VIGGFVLLILVIALWSNAADRKVSGGVNQGYSLHAVFQHSEGLTVGAQVRVAGMPVGQVVAQELDQRFQSHVTLRIETGVELPVDSAALIQTDGLLGSKYIELQPGGAEEMLPADGRLDYTQGALVLEDLLEKIIGIAKNRRAGPPPPQGPDGSAPAERSNGFDDSPPTPPTPPTPIDPLDRQETSAPRGEAGMASSLISPSASSPAPSPAPSTAQ
jgi:phospholipid/cholesterol/gamma-HCH transport system substrate-binding protein